MPMTVHYGSDCRWIKVYGPSGRDDDFKLIDKFEVKNKELEKELAHLKEELAASKIEIQKLLQEKNSKSPKSEKPIFSKKKTSPSKSETSKSLGEPKKRQNAPKCANKKVYHLRWNRNSSESNKGLRDILRMEKESMNSPSSWQYQILNDTSAKLTTKLNYNIGRLVTVHGIKVSEWKSIDRDKTDGDKFKKRIVINKALTDEEIREIKEKIMFKLKNEFIIKKIDQFMLKNKKSHIFIIEFQGYDKKEDVYNLKLSNFLNDPYLRKAYWYKK